MTPESIILSQVRELLRPHCLRLIRLNGGVFRGAGGGRVKTYRLYGPLSKVELDDERMPDLFGFLCDGRMVAIEVKSPDRGSNAAKRAHEGRQRKFLDAVKSAGGIAATIESAEEAEELIRKIECSQ